MAGVRYADLRGYSYDRSDVTARGLANAYAQTLGTVFTQESKPYEVEIVVAEVGATPATDQVYRLTYDGSVADEHGFVAMGGGAEQIEAGLTERWSEGLHLSDALGLAVELLAHRPRGRTRPRARARAARGRRPRPAPAAPDLPPDHRRPARAAAQHRGPHPATPRPPTTRATRPATRRRTRRPSGPSRTVHQA